MMKQLYMAVDLGTSFVKSGVYDLEGKLLAGWKEAVKDERPAPGIFIQRGEFLYDSVMTCLKKTAEMLGSEADKVCAIAFTGQMAGAMAVDEKWNDVTTWSCSLDGRYLPYADRQREAFADDLYNIGGTSAPVMCSKYAWFKDAFPEEHKRIAKYVMLNGYLIGRLSNTPVEDAMIDDSLIAWTGMADVRERCWSKQLCEEMGIEMALLPKIVRATTVGGYLNETIARELGLKSGIPLVLGAGDKVAGCTGAGILDEGDTIFEAASYGAVSCRVPEVRMDPEFRNYDVIGGIDDRAFYIHKYIQGSGITTDWFVDAFMREKGMSKGEAFGLAEELAAKEPIGSGKMLAIGLLGGSAIPFDSEVKGLFMGHTWSQGKGAFYHALLEGFSYELALTLGRIAARYPEYADSPIKLIGGGAKSAIWPQMLADVTGRRFEQLSREDVALWGAAMLAANGTGALNDIRESAKAHVQVTKTYVPCAEHTAAYAPYVALYQEFMEKLHPFYQKLNAL